MLDGFLFLDITIARHFEGLKVTFHLSDQAFILPKSLFMLAATESLSSTDLIGANRFESSAYRCRLFSHILINYI